MEEKSGEKKREEKEEEKKIVKNISRIYARAISDQPRSLIDFINLKIPIYYLETKDEKHYEKHDVNPYRLLDFIGQGSSGKVYRAEHKLSKKIVAIKIFFDNCIMQDGETKVRERDREKIPPPHVQKEIKILNHLGKSTLRIIQLYDVFYTFNAGCKGTGSRETLHMVFEYIPMSSNVFGNSKWLKRLSCSAVATYLYQLLKTLDYCHSKGIIHCDVKPDNIVLDSKENGNMLKLIDFGHSQFYWPDDETYPSATLGTVGYKAPEMLFKCPEIHYSVDVWSSGCVFLQMLFPEQARRFFCSSSHGDNSGQIGKLNEKFGTVVIENFCSKYGLCFFKLKYCSSKSWTEFLNLPSTPLDDVDDNINDSSIIDAMDLLNKLLEIDPIRRITCAEALKHNYFKSC
jgi:casein kinase II subunit alpha